MSNGPLTVRLRNSLIHGFTRSLMWIVPKLPEKLAWACARGLSRFAWAVLPSWRRNAMRGLEIFYCGQHPQKYEAGHGPATPQTRGDAEARREYLRIARASSLNLGYHVFEFMRLGAMPPAEGLKMVVSHRGLEHYYAALEKGTGAIGMAMHYGNWELSGAFLAHHVPLYAVGKEQRDAFFTNLAFPWRARYGINNIFSGSKVNSAIVRTLKDNHVLGLLADQNGGKSGTFAPFAETAASTPAGCAVLSLKTGAPLLLTYCRRIEPGRHEFIVEAPVSLEDVPGFDPLSRKYTEESVVEVLSRMNAVYETVIRRDPSQWLWGHKRWKTRPPGEAWLY